MPRGTGTLNINDEKVAEGKIEKTISHLFAADETMDVGEGSIITVPPGASHRFSNPGRDRLVLLIMNFFTDDATDEASSHGERPEQEKGE